MNAPLLGYAPPKEGALYIVNNPAFGAAGQALGRTGQYLSLDFANGHAVNLATGQALPMAGGRSGASMQFAGGGTPLRPSDVHYPEMLAGWLGGYRNGAMLLDQLVQTQLVQKSDFLHRDHAASDTYLLRDPRASQLSTPAQVQPTTSTTTRATAPLRIATFVPWLSEQESDYPLFEASARVAQNVIDLWREYAAYGPGGLFMTSGNWASTARLALGSTYNWGPPGSEGADSDPIRDLQTAIRTSFGNGMAYFVFSLANYQWFLSHPKVVDWYASKGRGGVTAGMIASIVANELSTQNKGPTVFDIPMIGRGIVHQARATTSSSVAADYFFSNDIVLGFVQAENMPPNAEICTAVTFQHANPSNGSPSNIAGMAASMPTNNGTLVRLVDMPVIGSGGRLLIIDRSELTCFTASNAGAFISGVS